MRVCPFCSEPAPERICGDCKRDTTMPRHPCKICRMIVPNSETHCWHCGAPVRSELRWKLPVIILVFVIVMLINAIITAVMK